MTVAVANVANTNTFDFWRNRTNELATAMSNVVVSTEASATPSAVSGNAAITGTFTANVLAGNTVYLSNTTSNVTISVPSVAQKTSGDFYLNATGAWSAVITPITTSNATTSGTTPAVIGSYAMADFGGAEFFIRVKDNIANSYHATKVLTFHNNVSSFSTEYGYMISNASLGTFAVSTNTTHVILSMTPNSTSTSVTLSRVNF
jgi:hypothetical protein